MRVLGVRFWVLVRAKTRTQNPAPNTHSSFRIHHFSIDSFDPQVRAEARYAHAFAHVEAAGERRSVLRLGLPLVVVPELAVGAVAVPAEVAVRDRLQREELEAAQQPVALRHLGAPAQDLNRDELFVRV